MCVSLFSHIAPYHFSLTTQKVSAFFSLFNRSFRHFQSLSLMVMEDDWDLHAVVRGCAAVTSTITTTSATATAVATSSSSSNNSTTGSSPVSSSSGSFGYSMFPIFEPKGLNSSIAQLNELCKPKFFFPKSHLLPNSFQVQSASASSPLSSSSFYSSSSALKSAQTQTQQKQHHLSNNKHSHAGSLTTPRSKRRKNQLKKVCQVPAEAVSSDIWAWRKYGQKPIKGSPYPRGYYRCSTSKACLARKQVERNRSDPTMFIVTYTAEHNHPAPTHRNSLAGSTRQKPPTHAAATGDSDKTPTKPISPATSGVEGELASQVTTTRSESKDEDEENEIGLSDMELSDDFFEGLDELTGSPAPPHAATGDCFADPFSACIEFPAWVANEASSTAGSI